jgi:hypothetical protein
MANTITNHMSSTEERVLNLLGMGINPETTAATCGISVSRISQLLSDPEFTAKVGELRFKALEKHNITDTKYDTMENRLLDSLKDCMPLIAMNPMALIKAIGVINNAKRRGISATEQITAQTAVVQLVMPKVIIQKFTTNINNQVINAGDQTLETISSSSLGAQYQTSSGKQLLNTINKKAEVINETHYPYTQSTAN